MKGGAVGMINNSWAARPRRDDTMVVQIDGTEGSAVAGRFKCYTQSAAETPEAFIKAARPGGVDLMAHWAEGKRWLDRTSLLLRWDTPAGTSSAFPGGHEGVSAL